MRQRPVNTPKTTSAIVVTREKGNFSDWIGYTDKGFLAFDFQDVHRTDKKNQCDLIGRPARPLAVEELNLPYKLLSFSSLVEVKSGMITFTTSGEQPEVFTLEELNK